MRFLADGPNIPDELLEARDRGEVVFLCGAGVSYPAGMPNFLGLAKHVVRELGTPPGAPARELLSIWDSGDIRKAAPPPLDQIFDLLQLDYDVSEIEHLIAKRLRTKPHPDVSTHETVLRLSRSADGKPQIVTTNFDLLFEYADKKLSRYVSPTLPNLTYEQGLDGIVYLHGRINYKIRRGEALQGLVVSSSDFGRAYLAEGWATRFILDLLDRYTVVLLGYSANDPPVRYLLQGLRKASLIKSATIYAFDRGTEEEVQAKWSDSSVRALAYPSIDDEHSVLWDTLEAWAGRADDPATWRQGVVELAQRGPTSLETHERGQVASLVKTIDGAKSFAEADPPPPGEWLCVFDSTIRYGKVERDPYEVLADFDPLVTYGLDDDPYRSEGSESEENHSGDDFLSLRSTDQYRGYVNLAEMLPQERIGLPDRLAHLVKWIVKVAHEPVVPWWAAKHRRIHPILVDRIEQHIRHNVADFPPLARSIWGLLFEKFRNVPDIDSPGSLYRVKRRIKAEGWTNDVLREFEQSFAPFLTTESRPFGKLGRPPQNDWRKLGLPEITEFEIGFPNTVGFNPEIRDDVLPTVYRISRRLLEWAGTILGEINPGFWETLKLKLSNSLGAANGNQPVVYLGWFRGMLERMISTHPGLVRADVALWPVKDSYFFHGLRLHVWSFDGLFTGDEIILGILSLTHESFWDRFYRREVLHLLKKRWRDIPQDGLRLLENRIVLGPPRVRDEPEDIYVERCSLVSANILGWLILHGCDLSEETLSILPRLQKANPDWHPDLDKEADKPYGEVRGGWVNRDEDPSALLDAPISKIVALAQENTGRSFENLTNHLPFDGLVKQCPRKALAALTREARKDKYPAEFWSPLLENWPDNARNRLTWLLGARVARLPSEIILELLFPVFSWLEKHFSTLVSIDETRAWSIFDAILNRLLEGGNDATRSPFYRVRVAGDSQEWSRKTIDYAQNGPVGKVAGLLLDLLESWNHEQGSGVPSGVKVRLEGLVCAPGEGADQAVSVIADRFEWLLQLDQEWAKNFIVPWFDPDNLWSEPAWNGFLRRHRVATPELLSLIKTQFLGVFGQVRDWKWRDDGLQVLHELLIQGCLLRMYSEVYITYPEARLALQKTDDRGRIQSIECLHDFIEQDLAIWTKFALPFLEEAWPRETGLQSEGTTIVLSQTARVTGDHFPEAVQAVLPRLVPIYGDSDLLQVVLISGRTEEYELAKRFPEATLALVNRLTPDSPHYRPNDLDLILEKTAEATPSLRQDWKWRRLKEIARLE